MNQVHFGLTNTLLCYEGTMDALLKSVSSSSEFQLKPEAIDYLRDNWKAKLKSTGVCYPNSTLMNNYSNKNYFKSNIKQGISMVNSNINFIDTHYPEKQQQIQEQKVITTVQDEPETKLENTIKKQDTQKMLIQQVQQQPQIKKSEKKIEIQLSSCLMQENKTEEDQDDDEELFQNNQSVQKPKIEQKIEIVDEQQQQLSQTNQIKQQEQIQKKQQENQQEDKDDSLSELGSSEDYINSRLNIKNQIFGYYEKVHRQRDKWRVIMKEMIGRIKDKEYIFNTLNGEFIFETRN